MWIVATFISVIIFFILSSIDDQRQKKKGAHPDKTRKIALFFFIAIVVFTGTFLLSGTKQGKEIINRVRNQQGGETFYETPKINEIHMLKNIREDIHVGGGPFTPQYGY